MSEDGFLNPLRELVSRGYTRAEEMLKNYYGVWGRDLSPCSKNIISSDFLGRSGSRLRLGRLGQGPDAGCSPSIIVSDYLKRATASCRGTDQHDHAAILRSIAAPQA